MTGCDPSISPALGAVAILATSWKSTCTPSPVLANVINYRSNFMPIAIR
jgi:hypothetical protein